MNNAKHKTNQAKSSNLTIGSVINNILNTIHPISILILISISQAAIGGNQNLKKSGVETFEKGKLDIYNEYLQDIQYELIPTRNSFIAIGQKLITDNRDHKGEPTTFDDILEEHIYSGQKPVMKKIALTSPSMILELSSFEELDHWQYDNFDHALASFLHSCPIFEYYKRRKINIKNSEIIFGNIEDWVDLCYMAIEYANVDKAKQFFEENFLPFLVIDRDQNTTTGKFTGYHEISIRGNLQKTVQYKYPLYTKPKWCKTQSQCPTRKEINEGALSKSGLELCWIDNPFNLWKMQIQGSGIVILPNGTYLRVAFGGTNQHSSRNVWDYIRDNIPTRTINQSRITKLLSSNQELATAVINHNPSYTFFTPNNKKFAVGAQGSGLTSSRSIAIDRRYIPYGMPMWIQTNLPVRTKQVSGKWLPLRRLTVAQDAGHAVKGVVRADIFYGHGEKATFLANHTNFKGSYYMLIPTKVIPDIRAVPQKPQN